MPSHALNIRLVLPMLAWHSSAYMAAIAVPMLVLLL